MISERHFTHVSKVKLFRKGILHVSRVKQFQKGILSRVAWLRKSIFRSIQECLLALCAAEKSSIFQQELLINEVIPTTTAAEAVGTGVPV